MKTIEITIPDELYQRLLQTAQEKGITISELVQQILERALAEWEKEDADVETKGEEQSK